VLDHDNLGRAIDLTIDRIEKSHLRGEDCALYAHLDKSHISQPFKDSAIAKIPRVFPMSNQLACASSIKDQTPSGSKYFLPS